MPQAISLVSRLTFISGTKSHHCISFRASNTCEAANAQPGDKVRPEADDQRCGFRAIPGDPGKKQGAGRRVQADREAGTNPRQPHSVCTCARPRARWTGLALLLLPLLAEGGNHVALFVQPGREGRGLVLGGLLQVGARVGPSHELALALARPTPRVAPLQHLGLAREKVASRLERLGAVGIHGA